MPQNLEVLDTTVQKTHAWINAVAGEAGWDDRHKAYLALRAVLHALRDRLTVDGAAHLSAQLPMLIRGLYYEGWRPSETPKRQRKAEEFLDAIAGEFPATTEPEDPEVMLRAVFRVIESNIEAGEVDQIKDVLPGEVRQLLAA